MKRTPDNSTLDWYGAGYDAFIDPPDHGGGPLSGWSLLRAAVASARRGDFGLIGAVARTIVARTSDFQLHQAAAAFVADAGDAAELEVLVVALTSVDRMRGLDIVRGLAARGRLVDVPAMFHFYEAHREHSDCDIIAAHLNWLLASSEAEHYNPGEHGWDEYREAVARRYFDLWNGLGTNLIHVRHGHAFDLRTLVHDVLADLREGFVDGDDRHAFEVSTGRSCSGWFAEEQPNFLTIAACLEQFLASGAPGPHVGERAFMGHRLERVGAAARVLAAYPPNHGMGVPGVRTTFDVDDYFALPFGFEPFHGGYHVRSTRPPPTLEWSVDEDRPWSSLHVGLRSAMAGETSMLAKLATWITPDADSILRGVLIHLVSRAADDGIVAPWRDAVEADNDPVFTLALCEGLLRRGVLRDIPRVLGAYLRHVDDPDYAHLPARLNLLLAFQPISHESVELPPQALRISVIREVERLRRELGRDDVPVYRGDLLDVGEVAREIIELRHSPYVTFDLREWFEAATGIDCSSWEVPDSPDLAHAFDSTIAAASAQKFLDSDAASGYHAGVIYFFGKPVGTMRV